MLTFTLFFPKFIFSGGLACFTFLILGFEKLSFCGSEALKVLGFFLFNFFYLIQLCTLLIFYDILLLTQLFISSSGMFRHKAYKFSISLFIKFFLFLT
jgi:hypothetical protein